MAGSLRTRIWAKTHHGVGILTGFLFIASLTANSKCLEMDHRRASVTLSDLGTAGGGAAMKSKKEEIDSKPKHDRERSKSREYTDHKEICCMLLTMSVCQS